MAAVMRDDQAPQRRRQDGAPTIRDHICELCAQAEPKGKTVQEVAKAMHLTDAAARDHLKDLRNYGRLHAGKVKLLPLQFFATAEARDAWVSTAVGWSKAKPKRASTTIRRGAAWTLNMSASKAATPGVRISPKAGKLDDGEADYSRAKVTVCPSPAVLGPAALVALQPDQAHYGAGFAAIGVGRYLQCDRPPLRRPPAEQADAA